MTTPAATPTPRPIEVTISNAGRLLREILLANKHATITLKVVRGDSTGKLIAAEVTNHYKPEDL